MESPFRAGDPVQTPLGKGVVREARNHGRVLVDVNGRSVVLDARTLAPVDPGQQTRKKTRTAGSRSGESLPDGGGAAADVDLHGLTVEEALVRAEQALNDALLADRSELRLIHGKGGGRLRAALHDRLAQIAAVRAFRLDPRNAGVTIVQL